MSNPLWTKCFSDGGSLNAETFGILYNPQIGTDLLPLNRARRLAGDVEHHAVQPAHFVGDAASRFSRANRTAASPIRRHAVLRFHGAHGDGLVVSALVALHADAAHRQQHSETLPDLVIPARWPSSPRPRWRRRGAESLSRSGVTSPRMRTAKPGPGNGWRITISSAGPVRGRAPAPRL